MTCPSCHERMHCCETREYKKRIRYRFYECVCGVRFATKEEAVDEAEARKFISLAINKRPKKKRAKKEKFEGFEPPFMTRQKGNL